MASLLDSLSIEECFGGFFVDEILSFALNAIAIIIISYLGLQFAKHVALRAKDKRTKVSCTLVALYYAALSGAALAMTGSMVSIMICPITGRRVKIGIYLFSVFLGFLLLFSSLLTAFVIRLHDTFVDSMFEISIIQKYLCLSIVVILNLCLTASIFLYWIHVLSLRTLWMTTICALFVFVVVSTVPVFEFIHNLMKMAKNQADQMDMLSMDAQKSVTDQQRKYINLSSKYASLFILAMVTSVVTTIASAICTLYLDVHPGILWSIDCVTNCICIHLYQSFASTHYERYCWRLSSCCREKLGGEIRQRNATKIATNIAEHNSLHSETTPVIEMTAFTEIPSKVPNAGLVSSASGIVATKEDIEYTD